jgi:negative regulator of flagellin synthesis FlgM
MKIGPIEPKAAPAAGPVTERKGGVAGSPPASDTEPSARVQLSASSVASEGDEGSFDTAKVERISAAIREGRFQVDAGAIADKLIANAQELLGRARN